MPTLEYYSHSHFTKNKQIPGVLAARLSGSTSSGVGRDALLETFGNMEATMETFGNPGLFSCSGVWKQILNTVTI